jgi:predicted O-methyltransferase YrrM
MTGAARALYDRLPTPVRRPLRGVYYALGMGERNSPEAIEAAFVDAFFTDRAEYETLRSEFESRWGESGYEDAATKYRQLTGRDTGIGGIGVENGTRLYALVRAVKPSVVVETGVCNGVSTMCVLSAMEENGHGTLHSIDFPYYADEPLSEFRAETFEEYGGAAIPADKRPGWLVPDELRHRWELHEGKSQRVLPEVIVDRERLDLFLHDSEHSVPCMMFEFELAWEALSEDGVIVADDIKWNDAFETFVDIRDADSGRVAPNVGYMRRPDRRS